MAKVVQRCSACNVYAPLESAQVRIYTHRNQWQFGYRLCRDCRQVLQGFLEAGALTTTKGIFDPPSPHLAP